MVSFECDYIAGAHPEILKRLAETNMESLPGYGMDHYSESAKEKIKAACECPEAEVEFLVGGTQTNAVVISTMLRDWEGVIAADSGHVSVHESGAVEYTGHKVLQIPAKNGKLEAAAVRRLLDTFNNDVTHDHMVFPGMVYISHPTEYGTLYTKEELTKIREVCLHYGMKLFLDGARLGYGLAAEGTDLSLKDIAALTDVFYIGGTKVGALFGEAVVFPKPGLVPHFYTITKQHGAMLAKGRITGIQFDVLFTDGLYEKIGAHAVRLARRIREALLKKGYELYIDSPTNQIFPIVTKEKAKALEEQVQYSFMEELDDGRLVIRFCTSWATRPEDVEELVRLL